MQLEAEQAQQAAEQKAFEANAFLHDKKTRRLAEYFKTKGLQIKSIQEVSPLIKKRYRLAKTVLDARAALEPLMVFLYQRKSDVYDVSRLSFSEKVSARNFLDQLKSFGWLEFEWPSSFSEVKVRRSIPREQYIFFNGGWVEEAT